MSREQLVIETFVHLADTLVDDFDADELLHVLAVRCVEVLDADAAGVMLALRPEQLRAVAATGRDMRQLEIFEVATTEGPSHEAFAGREPVAVDDLAREAQRWPRFVPQALQLGLRAGYGFPLRLRDRTIGALNLFQSGGRRRFSDADRLLAQGFADIAAIALLQDGLLQEAETKIEQLSHALQARIIVEQAKGVLAERRRLPPAEAFERLRSHARDNNVKLRDVAQAIVEGRLDVS